MKADDEYNQTLVVTMPLILSALNPAPHNQQPIRERAILFPVLFSSPRSSHTTVCNAAHNTIQEAPAVQNRVLFSDWHVAGIVPSRRRKLDPGIPIFSICELHNCDHTGAVQEFHAHERSREHIEAAFERIVSQLSLIHI